MRKPVILLFALLLATAFLPLSAQQNYCKVSGTVKRAIDLEFMSLSYASVYVQQQDSIVTGTLSGENGQFELEVARSAESYRLVVVYMGYKTKNIDFKTDTSVLALGRIILEPTAQTLEEVTVSAEKLPKVIRTVTHTSISPLYPTAFMGGSAEDVLRDQSAVTVDPDGNVSIRGNSNVLLLLDGVPTNLGSIHAIPSTNVASIDIITNPNATYDAEGTGGIINIVTKKGGNKGLTGMVAANYGFNHFVNGNIALNYTQQKFSLRFSYQVKYEDEVNNGWLYRYYRESGDSLSQQIHALRTTFNNNIALGIIIKPNMRNEFSADVRLILPRLNTVQNLANDWFYGGTLAHENRRSDVTWNRENIDGTISYWHDITPQRLAFSIKANVSKIWGHRPSYYFLEGDSVSRSVSGGSPFLASLQNDWRIMRKYGTWETGAKFSYRQNNIYHDFYMYDSTGLSYYYHPFSSDLLHCEYVPAAYMQFTSSEWKKIKWSAGIRLEYSQVQLHSEKEEIHRTSHDFFIAQSFSFQYTFNPKHSLSLAYSRRITRPTYPQLNPYMSMIDPHNFEQGNMNLKPEQSDNVELLYQFQHKPKWNVTVGLYYNHILNYITQVALFNADILKITYINAIQRNRWGLNVGATLQPWKWLLVTLGTDTYYVYEYLRGENDYSGWVNNSNLKLEFRPIKGMNISLQYFVNTPQYYPQFTTRLSHYMDIGISQKFLKGALAVSARLTDVFNTRQWEVFSETDYYRMSNMLHGKSRMVWLGISYNFNGYRKVGAAKPDSDDRSKIRTGL